MGRTPRAVRPTRPSRSAAGDHQRLLSGRLGGGYRSSPPSFAAAGRVARTTRAPATSSPKATSASRSLAAPVTAGHRSRRRTDAAERSWWRSRQPRPSPGSARGSRGSPRSRSTSRSLAVGPTRRGGPGGGAMIPPVLVSVPVLTPMSTRSRCRSRCPGRRPCGGARGTDAEVDVGAGRWSWELGSGLVEGRAASRGVTEHADAVAADVTGTDGEMLADPSVDLVPGGQVGQQGVAGGAVPCWPRRRSTRYRPRCRSEWPAGWERSWPRCHRGRRQRCRRRSPGPTGRRRRRSRRPGCLRRSGRCEDADPGRGPAAQVVEGQLAGRPQVVGGRVADQGEGARPEQPDPARLAVASRSSSRPARRDRLAEASARAGLVSARGACPGGPGPRGGRGLARGGAAPCPERDVGLGRAGHLVPGPDAGGAAAAGLGAGAGPGAAAAADQPGQDPAVGADPDLRGGRWPRRAETSAATSWALAAPALRASRPPLSAAAPIARFIHSSLGALLGSEFEDVEHVAEVARRERRPGGRSARMDADRSGRPRPGRRGEE